MFDRWGPNGFWKKPYSRCTLLGLGRGHTTIFLFRFSAPFRSRKTKVDHQCRSRCITESSGADGSHRVHFPFSAPKRNWKTVVWPGLTLFLKLGQRGLGDRILTSQTMMAYTLRVCSRSISPHVSPYCMCIKNRYRGQRGHLGPFFITGFKTTPKYAELFSHPESARNLVAEPPRSQSAPVFNKSLKTHFT